MPVQFVCDCGKKNSVRDEMAGKRVRCPACQSVVTVPAADEGVDDDARSSESPSDANKKSSSTMLYVGICTGVLLVSCCCLGGIVGGFFWLIAPNDKELTGSFPIVEKSSWTTFDGKTDISAGVKTPGRVRYKGYKIVLKANTTYTIDLMQDGGDSDPYLLLQDQDGKTVSTNDDGGGGLNARIVYTPTKTGEHRILAATIAGLGDFTLRISEIKITVAPKPLDKGN